MSNELIGIIITGIFSVTANYFVYLKRARIDVIEQAKRDQLIDDKFQEVSEKLDEHNGYAKMFKENSESIKDMKLEQKLMQQDIKYIKERMGKYEKA